MRFIPGWWLSTVLVLALLSAGLMLEEGARFARPPAQEGAEGEGATLFQEKCAGCHTIGGGDRVGPDMEGVTALRDRDWLVRFIVEPDRVIAEGDPIAAALLEQFGMPMPNLGLTEAQADAIVVYLEAQAGDAPAPPPEPPVSVTAPTGDPDIGRDLFSGASRLANGGAACIACHDIAGVGALGGGALGPDLTQTHAKFGADGTAAMLANLSFPTMIPIFGTRPLTPEEQAHLAALFQQTAEVGPPAQPVGQLALAAAAGAALLFGVMHLLWRRRLTAVRRPLVKG